MYSTGMVICIGAVAGEDQYSFSRDTKYSFMFKAPFFKILFIE